MWILESLQDLAADFTAIYHMTIDPELGEYCGLTGPRFVSLALRIMAFPGVMRMRLQNEIVERENAPQDLTPAVLTRSDLSGLFG